MTVDYETGMDELARLKEPTALYFCLSRDLIIAYHVIIACASFHADMLRSHVQT